MSLFTNEPDERIREFFKVKSIAASVSEDTGARIDTLQVRYWRPIHGEVMTHRVFSRNASSSRAIPHASLTVRDADIFIPQFRKNKAGMQPGEYLSADEQFKAEAIWRDMAAYCIKRTGQMSAKEGLNIHKQWVNRPLEWFGYIDVLISSTDWSNFDGLRIHGEAQDEIRVLAEMMLEAREAATPKVLKHGEWHLPYITQQDVVDADNIARQRALPGEVVPKVIYDLMGLKGLEGHHAISARNALLLAISTARCCRVSYSKHDGARPEIETDLNLYLRLAGADPKHASPLEHQARPLLMSDPDYVQGNFSGFAQFRKFVPNERL
ncbi:putative thymidylate synthase [Caulobacter phage CcrPW]|uniref:Putative thymidylate synthase n=1 Tax=Caulobacter phage CcrPW TaxID=2283271 RepID=A0A385ED01_9CAUD|nr:putative thymidylate synthase [Caulobacter phage CcrPW]AXQ68697.1 putative thymidylate synthase [Caulobacter phage CcrPW]